AAVEIGSGRGELALHARPRGAVAGLAGGLGDRLGLRRGRRQPELRQPRLHPLDRSGEHVRLFTAPRVGGRG
ncbi:MAG: hypothetical protein ACK56I_03085, partial [bacterium]